MGEAAGFMSLGNYLALAQEVPLSAKKALLGYFELLACNGEGALFEASKLKFGRLSGLVKLQVPAQHTVRDAANVHYCTMP